MAILLPEAYSVGKRPLGWASAEHISTGYRKRLLGSHVIFFRCQTRDTVEVVRIFNQHMDVPSHL